MLFRVGFWVCSIQAVAVLGSGLAFTRDEKVEACKRALLEDFSAISFLNAVGPLARVGQLSFLSEKFFENLNTFVALNDEGYLQAIGAVKKTQPSLDEARSELEHILLAHKIRWIDEAEQIQVRAVVRTPTYVTLEPGPALAYLIQQFEDGNLLSLARKSGFYKIHIHYLNSPRIRRKFSTDLIPLSRGRVLLITGVHNCNRAKNPIFQTRLIQSREELEKELLKTYRLSIMDHLLNTETWKAALHWHDRFALNGMNDLAKNILSVMQVSYGLEHPFVYNDEKRQAVFDKVSRVLSAPTRQLLEGTKRARPKFIPIGSKTVEHISEPRNKTISYDGIEIPEEFGVILSIDGSKL